MSKRGLPSTVRMRHESHYVEELWTRTGAPIGRMIPIDRLEPNPNQPRIEFGDLEELTNSIREKGVLEPLLVRPAEVGGRFMIISGERRYRASLLAGLRELPCIEMDVDDRAVAEIALIENLQRKDLTPFEEAEGLTALAERFSYTHEEMARKLGKSRSSITESLAIGGLSPEIRELCRQAGITSKSTLLQIVRRPSDEDRRALIARIRQLGLTRDAVRQTTKTKKRATPFRFRFQEPARTFTLDLKFRKSDVDKRQVVAALKQVVDELERELEAGPSEASQPGE
ncbi:ParB/RepB/Spo0J family partition protein [Chloracidobacterium aggregatum]|uniref:ParB/RepB/Spo0J family partition protein n=2 Tax=Chloracidobacterium TaxID=458032 RepID=A0ABX8B065_9BACT|nr:ParB/RepB/Spo0J family partition protein [Chloracidobacterium aggregatum]QUV84662.1 ParB/RepB/Spo0J family partition protein [Chloracidobacterium sp. 2]QUV91832.1 ParB/RepB/Spo0J family partition protein [Chloracidobacterium sp. A]QUV92966.1 ParB/RepB/Spo0J family partition protein [Chloracidobacterium sp. N]QUV96120.1 ParB/RepB/Spo0J family partition protein [Chloracidobacterium sp. E]